MNAQVLRGSKQEIAAKVTQISGEVREVIVFIEEPLVAAPGTDAGTFAEMEPYLASAGGADYSREALYSRTEGE